jgi:hypothetical protein
LPAYSFVFGAHLCKVRHSALTTGPSPPQVGLDSVTVAVYAVDGRAWLTADTEHTTFHLRLPAQPCASEPAVRTLLHSLDFHAPAMNMPAIHAHAANMQTANVQAATMQAANVQAANIPATHMPATKALGTSTFADPTAHDSTRLSMQPADRGATGRHFPSGARGLLTGAEPADQAAAGSDLPVGTNGQFTGAAPAAGGESRHESRHYSPAPKEVQLELAAIAGNDVQAGMGARAAGGRQIGHGAMAAMAGHVGPAAAASTGHGAAAAQRLVGAAAPLLRAPVCIGVDDSHMLRTMQVRFDALASPG